MPRLFVALSLPNSTQFALAQLAPPNVRGVRVTAPSQMHVTLHFLGDVPLERALDALSDVIPSEIELAISGVGRFRARDGEQVLWAGLRPSPALLDLHGRMGEALRRRQFHVEQRPYAPHVTLARCRRGVPPELIEDFLGQHRTLTLPPVTLRSFELYSSHVASGGHEYRLERSFAAPA